MTAVNDNPDSQELGFGKVVEDAVGLGVMTAEEFQAFIHPLTNVDAARLFTVTPRYIGQMISGERKPQRYGFDREDIVKHFKYSEFAIKSRQQFRNAVSFKAYTKIVCMDNFNHYKCRCCLYPASETIYNIALCEACVSKAKLNNNKNSEAQG